MHRTQQIDRLNVVLLGDQTSNVSTLLHKLLLGAPHSVVQSDFIRDAGAALRGQYDRLRPFQRECLPAFKDIHDLARLYQDSNGICHPSISSTLLCVTQLLQIFRYFEGRGRCPENNANIAVVGLCTGSLVAAAYAASASIDDLKALAGPTVSMAFQLGLQAATASSMLHDQGNTPGSWSIAIARMTEDEALSALNIYDAGGRLSLRHRCFVSAVGLRSVTISGSPPALSRFADSLLASNPSRKLVALPIFAAYHASHIHTVLDFPSFLTRSGINPNVLANFKSVKTMLSPLTGQPVESTNALGLFQAAVHHTLQAPLRLDLIAERCVQLIDSNCISKVRVDVVEPTSVADSLATMFRSRCKVDVSTHELVVLDPDIDEYRPSAAFHHSPLAIVGMSGRFPGAESAEALWDVLTANLDLHRVVPGDRFDAESHVDPTGKRKNTSWTPYGCFIENPGDFDPRFFNMSPKEALQTDPMQRLALVTAYEALEMSGFVPNRTRSSSLARVGTFYGQTSDDYRDVNSAQDIGTYFITGGIRAFGPGRINYFFKFSGPSYSVDTACSSSLAAIQLACSALWNGECDTAVAGGLSVLTSPDLFAGLSRGQFLSQTGSCKTFDNGADGYCRADGIGTVVVKRLSDAEADRDNILGVILSAATNHSANAVSITHPHAETQSTLYHDILHQAGLNPLDVGYIEMHGTGTQAGDGMEMRSVAEVFAPEHPRREDENPLYVGAVKASIGHGEASSGVASLIKALLVLKHRSIPAHVGIKNKINQTFPDLKARNIRIPLQQTAFPRVQGKKRTILVNNFSAAGGNTALILQEPPANIVDQGIEPRPVHPVTISGHTRSALQNNLQKLIAYLSANPQTSLVDLSYTTTARRRHHGFRVTVTESSLQRACSSLERQILPVESWSSRPQRPIVFVFTGQGALYPSLACELYTSLSQFQADIDHFDGIARQQGFPSFISMVDGSATDLQLLSPMQTQIGLVCIQVALARLWSSWGIKPSAVVGHSLGEYAALQVAGVLSISDTIYLVGYRARLLDSRCEAYSNSMLAVTDSTDVIQTIPDPLRSTVEVACANSPHETVFAASNSAIDQLEAFLTSQGARATKLQVPYAFHSSQVNPILDEFEQVANVVNLGKPSIQIISPTAGRVLHPGDHIDGRYLREHCRQTVQFADAVQAARSTGAIQDTSVFIEIGPHPICSAMIKTIIGNNTPTLPTLKRKDSAWKVIVGSLAALHDMGFNINWCEYYRDVEGACRLLTLPAYAFDNKKYWIDYRNAWTLRKGDPTPETRPSLEAPPASARLSSSVHRVVEEKYSGPDPRVVFETNLSGKEIHTAVSGHRVNGAALCPSSVYADVALTIARHIQQQPQSGFILAGHSVMDMEIQQPLIIKLSREDEDRVLRVYAQLDQQLQVIKLTYSSASPAQKKETNHASCWVKFEAPDKWLSAWRRDLHLIQNRIGSLERLVGSGEISVITRQLSYRLFSSLVDYALPYQRMERVHFASRDFEASAVVKLDDRGDDLTFYHSPYWLDALLHISGFVMNGNDTLNPHEAVYISHGWESIRFGKPLNPNGHYQTYVRMLPTDKTMVGGNVWILCDGEVVGLAEGLRFQRVPRTVLDMLLPPVGAKPKRPDTHSHSGLPPKAPQKPIISSEKRATSVPLLTVRGDFTRVIAAELGMQESAISPKDSLSDLGVDSLMSLSLAGNLLEAFGVEIWHSQLMGCSTVGDLLDILEQKQGPGRAEFVQPLPNTTDHRKATYHTSDTSESLAGDIPTPDSTHGDAVVRIQSIIIEETGMAPEDLGPAVDLGGLGIDSLMSLAILGRLREEGIELPSTFFVENPTMNDVVRAISGEPSPPAASLAKAGNAPSEVHADHPRNFRAKAILLQKRSRPSTRSSLFLFPDGSGSPSSYAALQPLGAHFDVYGLACPFVTSPEHYTGGIEATVRIYLSAIRKQQAHGPYHLGGWSAGGVLAYEAAKQLIDAGFQVESLLLIDAPCPVVLPPMPSSLVNLLYSEGLFGRPPQSRSPNQRSTLLRHFDATVSNLTVYKPSPIHPAANAPQTLVIWAREGVTLTSSDSKATGEIRSTESWILDDRTDFGPQGWEAIIPTANIQTTSVPGNHFTVMNGTNVTAVSRELQTFLSTFQ